MYLTLITWPYRCLTSLGLSKQSCINPSSPLLLGYHSPSEQIPCYTISLTIKLSFTLMHYHSPSCTYCLPSHDSLFPTVPCHEGSTMHDDGDFWSPVSCSQCQCRNGRAQCYVAHCPPLTCPANHTLEVAPGSCCPTCEGNPCVQKGMVYGVSP